MYTHTQSHTLSLSLTHTHSLTHTPIPRHEVNPAISKKNYENAQMKLCYICKVLELGKKNVFKIFITKINYGYIVFGITSNQEIKS
jgi:hypothetical protein